MSDDFRGSRVLVTGAAGAIGANLVRALMSGGAEVHAIVRPATNLWRLADVLSRLHLYHADLIERSRVAEHVASIRPDYVFHLATERPARKQPDRERLLQGIVLGILNLLDAVAALDIRRVVCTGSSLEYGPKSAPIKETDTLEPTSLFGVAKASSTLLSLQVARERGYPLVVLRPFSVYGYWEAPSRLIPMAIRAALRGDEIMLTAPGYRHDFVFVEDVVEACLCALHAGEVNGRIINIASGQQTTNEEVVAIIGQIIGQSPRVKQGVYPAREWDTECWVADISQARDILGWEPRHMLPEGLAKTVEWFRTRIDHYGPGQ
jgi:nucleoside-diphosphate-sugar epimerase